MDYFSTIRPPKAPNLPIGPVEYDQRYQDQLLNVLRLYFNTIDNFGLQVINTDITPDPTTFKYPYFSAYQNGHTALTGAMTNNSTTPIQVTSTDTFAASGYLIIGSEIIAYTGKTSTTFTGITRGAKSTTNVAHSIGVAVSEAAAVTAGSSAAATLDTVISSYQITCTVPDSKVYFTKDGTYNIQFSMQLLNYATAEDNVTVWFKKNGNPIDYSSSIQQVSSVHANGPGAIIIALNYVDEFAAGDHFELF